MSENTESAWDAAMQEQRESDTGAAAAVTADDWAAAIAESNEAAPTPTAQPAQVFPPMQEPARAASGVDFDMDRIKNIPVQLTAELGRTRITIKELLHLSQGSVVELEGLAGQPLEVKINGFLVAQGEVVQVGDKYGIRLTDIILPSERIEKLARA